MSGQKAAKYRSLRAVMETFYDLQKIRIALGNRLISRCALLLSKSEVKKVKRRCDRPTPCEQCEHYREAEGKESLKTHKWQHPDVDPLLKELYATIHNTERQIYRNIIKPTVNAKNIPIWGYWLSKVKGIGPAYALGLVSFIRDIGRFDTVSKLWAYAGLAPGQRLERGKKATWNPRLRTLCWKIGKQFVKQGGGYKRIYKESKVYYQNRPDLKGKPKRVIDAHARRRTVKLFLSHLWVQWRRLEGLPTRPHYDD